MEFPDSSRVSMPGFYSIAKYNLFALLGDNIHFTKLHTLLFFAAVACCILVWVWPASLREIGSLEDNMQLSRNDEYV